MTKEGIYSVTGLFHDPDKMIHAVEEVAEAGYTKYDVHTPYPLHGMDDAMRLQPSKLGYLSFLVGFCGVSFIISFIGWIVLMDYRTVYAGKPFFGLPAYVPIMFEFMVLSCGVLSAVLLIILFFRFPQTNHPLHDTDYMKRVSDDSFGISIEAEDPLFEEAKVKQFLTGLGADNVTSIHYDVFETRPKYRVLDPKFIAFTVAVILVSWGGFYVILNHVVYWLPFNWMNRQEKVSAQQRSRFFEDGFSMRTPVAGTVAKGYIPYAYAGQPEQAEKYLSNPLMPTPEVLALGEKKFQIYCSMCHGTLGQGDSRLHGKFPPGANLHGRATDWPDGRIYHVMTDGQNVMPSYAKQLSRDERWAIVHYVRALQRSLKPTESDVK